MNKKKNSITIQGIDKQLTDLIKSKYKSEALSISKTVRKSLKTSLGVTFQIEKKRWNDFKRQVSNLK